MTEFFLMLNEPTVLWSLFGGAIALVLIDYLFPVDWPAYVGYVLFALFVGATISAPPLLSLAVVVAVLILALLLHRFLLSRFLTNAPMWERRLPAATKSTTSDPQKIDTV
jgi:hypothetical protein